VNEFAPVSWAWEQMGSTCKSNFVLYSPIALSSRTTIENGTLYLQLCPRRVGSPSLSSAPLKSGNPSFSWDRPARPPSCLPGREIVPPSNSVCVCLESRVPRNPTEKISSGYKAVEYVVYIFGLCPALHYRLLPQKFYFHFCKLVFAMRMIHRHHKSRGELLAAHQALLEFVYKFEIQYHLR
jgi:hypothetical protein